MFKSSYLVGIILLLNAASNSATSETAVNVTEARARLDQGSIALSGKFLQFLVSTNPDENCVASPMSLTIPMAQLALFAKELVLDQILKLINLKSKQEIMACFPGLIAELSRQSHVDLKMATKNYANKKYPLSIPFKRDSKKYVGADGQNVDFSKPDEVSALINEWVYNQTNGKIEDLVVPEMFSADTRLCLVNAIYFLGNWEKQFNPNDTEVKDFYKSNGETVPMKIMYQKNTFNYAETDQYQVLEMFYKSNNFSFVIVLPRNKEDLLPTLKTIQEPGVWNQIMGNLSPQLCLVYVPKMLINTKIDLQKLLKKYGVDKMFDPNYNGFEGMLEKEEPIFVSDAVQKAFMSFDETGTEAAAATAFVLSRMNIAPVNPPKMFNANHPFIYYIKFRETVLFCGAFVK